MRLIKYLIYFLVVKKAAKTKQLSKNKLFLYVIEISNKYFPIFFNIFQIFMRYFPILSMDNSIHLYCTKVPLIS